MIPGEFEMAVRHLERGRSMVEEQRIRIDRLAAHGDVSDLAAQFLVELERSVAGFEQHLRILLAEWAEEEAARRH